MSPFGDRDVDWLVYSDWLEEHGQSQRAEQIRSEINDLPEIPWNWEYRFGYRIAGVGDSGVGGSGVGGSGVGGSGVGGSGVGGVGVGGVGGSG